MLDLKSGITLKQAYDYISALIEANLDNIKAYQEALEANSEVSDEELDALEHKEQYTPEDMLTLARATGLDYTLRNSPQLPDDFNDKFRNAVSNLYTLRNKFKPRQEVTNANTSTN